MSILMYIVCIVCVCWHVILHNIVFVIVPIDEEHQIQKGTV